MLQSHPIGSYYWSDDPTNPSELFGGEWEQIKDVFVLAAGDKYEVGNTGGETEHILEEAEMPAHAHTRGTMDIVGSVRPAIRSGGHPLIIDTAYGAFTTNDEHGYMTTNTTLNSDPKYKGAWINFQASKTWTGKTSFEGSNEPHNNMPPYATTYCWKRIA